LNKLKNINKKVKVNKIILSNDIFLLLKSRLEKVKNEENTIVFFIDEKKLESMFLIRIRDITETQIIHKFSLILDVSR